MIAIAAFGALTLAGGVNPAMASTLPPSGYVDLTYAAEKALPKL